MTRTFWTLPAAAVLATVLGGSLPAHAQAPIKIGASLSLTGTYAKPGTYEKEGYDVCADEVNGKGGLLGRKIEFVLYDDQSAPATAVKLYEKLITEDKVDAVMGPYSSPITEAVANVTEKYKKVMVSPLAATTSIFRKGRKYIFMVISPAEVYLEGLIDMAAKRGLKTVAIINEDTLFTKASANGTAELAKKRGMQVVLQEAYPKGNTDFSGLLKQNAEYVYGSTQWDESLPYPGQKEFLAGYKKKFKHEPSYHAAAGYAGCLLYVEAAKRAGTLDADKVRDELLKLKTRAAFGDYAVDQDGFQIAHKMVMLQWQEGKRIIVWPDELANGKARFPTPPWNQR